MPIPALDENGLLPVGVHDCSWEEIKQTFCWNVHRTALFDRVQDFFTHVWSPLGLQLPIWVDGSFTRKKENPADIDVVVEADLVSSQDVAPALDIWLAREQYKSSHLVDFWIRHPLFPTDLCAFFQYTGLKAGAELQLDARHPKGILRVLP